MKITEELFTNLTTDMSHELCKTIVVRCREIADVFKGVPHKYISETLHGIRSISRLSIDSELEEHLTLRPEDGGMQCIIWGWDEYDNWKEGDFRLEYRWFDEDSLDIAIQDVRKSLLESYETRIDEINHDAEKQIDQYRLWTGIVSTIGQSLDDMITEELNSLKARLPESTVMTIIGRPETEFYDVDNTYLFENVKYFTVQTSEMYDNHVVRPVIRGYIGVQCYRPIVHIEYWDADDYCKSMFTGMLKFVPDTIQNMITCNLYAIS